MGWTVLVHQDPKDPSYYWATVRELPGLVTEAKTLGELRRNVAEAIELYLPPDEAPADSSGPVVHTLEAAVIVQ